MNAPDRSPSGHLAPPADAVNPATDVSSVVVVEREAPAANADAVSTVSNRPGNPLWMIAVGMAIFFGALAILVSTG